MTVVAPMELIDALSRHLSLSPAELSRQSVTVHREAAGKTRWLSGPRRRKAADLERDLGLFDPVQNKQYSHAKAVEEWNGLHPENEFDADLSRVSALVRRLRRDMQPR
jgi:hypothetical protein